MQKNFMSRFLWIVFASGMLLTLYPVLHDNSSFLQNNFRSYSVIDRFFKVEDLIKEDTSCVDQEGEIVLASSTSIQSLYSGMEHLHPFFKNLPQKESQTRIAYYGDSSIEGDLITQTVRDSLQKRFGGSGVGFVPLISHISGFRRSVYHHFSEDWVDLKMNKSQGEGITLGYMGLAFVCEGSIPEPKDSLINSIPPDSIIHNADVDSINLVKSDSLKIDTISTVAVNPDEDDEASRPNYARYVASRRFEGTNTFASSRLFYSNTFNEIADYGQVKVKTGDFTKTVSMNGGNKVNSTTLHNFDCRKIELDFENVCNQFIYGVSFESEEGVILDNLPFRGNSGAWLTRINSGVLQSFQKQLDVDLVVLQYGLNVLNAEMTDYSWYSTEMKRVVSHIQKSFPGACILIAGPADRAVKLNGKMQTDPSIPLITNVLRKVAEEKEVAFFSFYEAMGGKGSMVKWVEEYSPKLANSDYTHFNFEGAEKAGNLLLDFLLKGYDNYLEVNQPQQIN